MKILSKEKTIELSRNVNVTKSGVKISEGPETVTLDQVWLLYQVLSNQVKLTLQKPAKIWDQRNMDVKSEMSLNQVTKRR